MGIENRPDGKNVNLRLIRAGETNMPGERKPVVVLSPGDPGGTWSGLAELMVGLN